MQSNAEVIKPPVLTDKENSEMWKTLDKRDKVAMYKLAQEKFPYLGEHFKNQNTKLSDDNFTETHCFKLLMELLGRRESKRTKLPELANKNPV